MKANLSVSTQTTITIFWLRAKARVMNGMALVLPQGLAVFLHPLGA